MGGPSGGGIRSVLHRYWLEFEGEFEGEQWSSAFGVTAFTRDDALAILRDEAFKGDVPRLVREIEDVDVSQLDANHVLLCDARGAAHVAKLDRLVVESARPNERTPCRPGSGS